MQISVLLKDLTILHDLLPYLERADFVMKTQQQLIKDFEKFNLSFEPLFHHRALTKDEIVQYIGENLIELMKEGEGRLLQLMYTIDVTEKEFLALTTDPNFLELLSEKILFREAYKVFLRTKFH